MRALRARPTACPPVVNRSAVFPALHGTLSRIKHSVRQSTCSDLPCFSVRFRLPEPLMNDDHDLRLPRLERPLHTSHLHMMDNHPLGFKPLISALHASSWIRETEYPSNRACQPIPLSLDETGETLLSPSMSMQPKTMFSRSSTSFVVKVDSARRFHLSHLVYLCSYVETFHIPEQLRG